jgi:molybdenum cofactor cytidylyltransferase
VLGAEARQCLEALGDLGVRTFINPHWDQGMGASIASGVAEIARLAPQIDGVLILLHDQPAIPAERLCQLVAARQENDLIVAAEYDDITGVPAYFRRELFDELQKLGGPQGAKKILQAHAPQLRRFDLPEAKFDIDTPADYQRVCGTQALKI